MGWSGEVCANGNLGNCSFSVQSDGAYVTYTPEGGADTVTKKLGDTGYQLVGTITGITAENWQAGITYQISGYTAVNQFMIVTTKISTHLRGTVDTGREYNATITPMATAYDSKTGLLTIGNASYINVGGDADYKYRYYMWASEIAIYTIV